MYECYRHQSYSVYKYTQAGKDCGVLLINLNLLQEARNATKKMNRLHLVACLVCVLIVIVHELDAKGESSNLLPTAKSGLVFASGQNLQN